MADGIMLAEESFTAEVRRDLIWIEWVTRMTVADHEALCLVDRTAALSPEVCAPMLVMLNEMESLSRDALKVFARDLNIADLALVGPSAVDQLTAIYFIEVHNPSYPTRHFETVDEAQTWLATHPPRRLTPQQTSKASGHSGLDPG